MRVVEAPVTDEHERACRRLEVVVPRPSRPLPTATRRRLHCRHACCQHANRSRWLHDLRAWFAAGTLGDELLPWSGIWTGRLRGCRILSVTHMCAVLLLRSAVRVITHADRSFV